MADEGRVPTGTYLAQDDRVGHPSCEGGKVTGTHLHLARKFNGETPYKGTLTRGGQVITAHTSGAAYTWIVLDD